MGLLSGHDTMIFNVHNDLSARCAHEDETGTDESAQALTRKKWRERKKSLAELSLSLSAINGKVFRTGI